MKVLIFTHKSDIDGMGGAILSKLAFENVDYVLCETFSLQNEKSRPEKVKTYGPKGLDKTREKR